MFFKIYQKKSTGGTLIKIKMKKNLFFLKIIKKCFKVVFNQIVAILEKINF
jgi:hypothetical protein